MDTDSGAEELGQVLTIGDHCSVDHCRQVDFLPFKCDCCSKVFCLEHRTYSAHACPLAGSKETTIIVCPICAKGVRLVPGQDPNQAFDAHTRGDCDPANYNKVHRKPRCPVPGCKEKLTTINAYRCKHCAQRICLKHRDPRDHRCEEAQAATKAQQRTGFMGSLAGVLGSGARNGGGAGASGSSSASSSRPASAPRGPAPASSSAAAAAAQTRKPDAQQLRVMAEKQYDDPANSVRGTAARRAQLAAAAAPPPAPSRWPWQAPAAAAAPAPPPPVQPPLHVQPPPPPAPASNANPLVQPHRPEKCPQCGAAFETVARLIQHVEDFHPSGSAAGSGFGSGGGEAAAGFVSNPLRGLLGGTIAGGTAPPPPPPPPAGTYGNGGSLLQSGAGAGGVPGGAEDRFRCHFCSRTFNDPVLLVQHADRCPAATAAAVAGGRGGGAGRGSGADGSSNGCVLS